ncbi:hypothetical protein TNCV_3097901 [Trichonephila clavipes]|nr:hypothetical protein TNCV_3097901 [Trichonephila clavipes]
MLLGVRSLQNLFLENTYSMKGTCILNLKSVGLKVPEISRLVRECVKRATALKTILPWRTTLSGRSHQSRGNHGQPHQSHMMRFSGRQQFNNQPRQFVQQNRHNLNSPRNESNQRQG